LDLNETEGFYIQTLQEGMGAESAGLAPKDIIKSVDGNKINKFSDLTGYLSTKRPGDQVAVDYIRDGVRKKVTVELKKLKRTFFHNMELKNLNPKEKKERDLENGVEIINNNNRTLYMYGIGEGSILLEINGQSIDDISQLDAFPEEDIESLLILTPDDERIIFRN
jgi:S1-C subfamily serine protease